MSGAIFGKCMLTFGPMKTILTDMGTEYMNSVLTELCKTGNIPPSNSGVNGKIQ